jgi:DNA-binding MarR family transcriptional regulator
MGVVTSDQEWLTDREQRAWRAFMLASQQVDAALDRQLQRDAGMPHAYYGILTVLVEAGVDGLRMSELARVLRFSPSRLAHAVGRMERSGWVERHDCPTDRRGQIAAVTPAGAHAQREAAPGHVAMVRELVFDHLDAAQVEQLERICSAVAARAAELDGAQPASGPSPNS